jgi:hypothetical protein
LSLLPHQVDKQAERRIAVLTDLFNVLPEPHIRYKLLMDALAYAKQASLAGLIAPTVKVCHASSLRSGQCSAESP